MSPSLGWLQAFLCAADHLDYECAAKDLGINANGVRLRVQKLEQWLHKLLILDNPTELNERDGVEFIPIALEALQRFEAACSGGNGLATGVPATPRTKLMSKISLNDLERFLSVADELTYKGAAISLSCDVSTIHRNIKDLERVTKNELLSGRVSLQLTEAGEMFRDAASFITKSLHAFRAVIPDDYDPLKENVRNLHDLLLRRRVNLQWMAALIARTGKKQRGRVRLVDVHHSLEIITKVLNEIEAADAFPCTSVRGPDLDDTVINALTHPSSEVSEWRGVGGGLPQPALIQP